jgi:choice-of-anchor A domain-containing protein
MSGSVVAGRSGAVALVLSLGLLGSGTSYAAVPADVSDRSDSCPASGEVPGIGHNPKFTDGNVALFAGGNYTVDGGSAEAEGLLVVKGDATFAKQSGGTFNVGRVGAGSGILPDSGDVMLAVGGDLSIARGTTVDVGHGLTAGPRYGGSVHVGKEIDEKGDLETNGGERKSGTGVKEALSPYDTFDRTIGDESSSLGSLKPTGTTVRQGGAVTFRSTGASKGNLQVFEISAAELDGASTFFFEAVPDGASVVVNVTGSHPVSISPMSVGFNGDRADTYDSPVFGEAASRILYNFEGSTSLTLGGGGNFMGSLLAPEASADLTASTNGRVYIGGDVKTHGSGNETHNYPWAGSPAFKCKPAPSQPEKPTPPVPTTPGGSASPSPTRPGESTPPPAAESAKPSRPAPAVSESTPAPAESSPAPSNDEGYLASTGAQVTMYAAAAAVLGALGFGLLAFTRRRRRRA